MFLTKLNSAENPNVKRWNKLASHPRAIKKLNRTLAEGVHVSGVAYDSGAPVYAAILREDSATEEAKTLFSKFSNREDVRLFTLPASLYEAVAPVANGVGIMVELEIPETKLPATSLDTDALYLDGIQDAGNVGTILRTALASGVRFIAASAKTALIWSPKVMRAAMGAHFGLTIYEDIEAKDIKKLFAGKILAADARGGADLFQTKDWEATHTTWMFGAEGPGLSLEALNVSEARYLIPIESDCESLNVAIAAAVCLFEQKRRRLLKSSRAKPL